MIHRHRHRALVALAFALSVILPTAAQVDPSKQQQFADNLTSLIYTNENDFSSALGVSMAFSLIWPGCTGDAIDEVRQTMGYPEDGSNLRLVWEETTQSLLAGANGECSYDFGDGCESYNPLLQIANSVWSDDGDVLNSTYQTVVGDYAMQTDFEAEDSPLIVNEWVKNSTNGLIDSIVPEGQPLFPPLVLIAINSIYLKASWMDQFEKSLTNLDTFYDSPSRTTEVAMAHFMHQVEYFAYSHEALSGYQVIDLPLANAPLSVVFVLPMTDGANAVTSTDLISALDTLPSTRVALSLPKFKFESTYDDGLQEALMQLGIVAPFTAGSGALCGIFDEASYDCTDLIIDKIIQKTVIDVNEEGVEAAAVTAVMVGVTSAPIEDPILMVLDHPFQFFIYNRDEQLMLFEGRLGLPKVPETESEVPLLDAVHSDSDFWSNTFGVNPVDPTTTATSSTVTTTANVENQPSSTATSTPSSDSTDQVESLPTQSTSTPSSKPSPSSTGAATQSTSSTTSKGSAPQPIETSDCDLNVRFRLSAWIFMCFSYGLGLFVW
jgi:serpin B